MDDSQALGGAQDRVPFFGGRGHRQMDGLALLLRQLEGAREELLLFEAEKLLGRQLVLA